MHRNIITKRTAIRMLLIIGLLSACSSVALACPLCHTETGKQVRSGIFAEDFGINLLITFLPFAICLGVVAIIYFRIPTIAFRSDQSRAAITSRSYAKGQAL